MLRELFNVNVKQLLISFERLSSLGEIPEDTKKAVVIFIFNGDKKGCLDIMGSLISIPRKVKQYTIL